MFGISYGPAASGRGLCDIEFYSELLNHVSENWEVLARPKYTDNWAVSILIVIAIQSISPF